MDFHRRRLLKVEQFFMIIYLPIMSLISVILGSRFDEAFYITSALFVIINSILCIRYTIPIKVYVDGRFIAFLGAGMNMIIGMSRAINTLNELLYALIALFIFGILRCATLIRIVKFPSKYEVTKPRKKDRKWHEHD